MAPAKGEYIKKALRRWSGAPLDLSREQGDRHRPLRPRGKARRSVDVEADDDASGDETDDVGDAYSPRNGAQHLLPSPSATPTTARTPGTMALPTLVPVHLHVTTTVLVPLMAGSSVADGGSTSFLPVGAWQTAPAGFTSTALSARPTDTGSIELSVSSNGIDGYRNSTAAAEPPTQARDPTAERALIAVGSIGAFVTVCFLYFAWRAWRRGRQDTAGDAHPPRNGDGLRKRLADRIAVLCRRRSRPWTHLENGRDAPGDRPSDTDTVWPTNQDSDDEKASIRVRGLQDVLPRVPPPAAAPTDKRTSQDSATSSLSSGFGDGVTVTREPQQPGHAVFLLPPWGRGSSFRRASGATVHTEAGEDGPHRFRSVASWVRQQAGRLQQMQVGHGEGGRDSGAGVAVGDGLAPRRLDAAGGL